MYKTDYNTVTAPRVGDWVSIGGGKFKILAYDEGKRLARVLNAAGIVTHISFDALAMDARKI